MQVAYDYFVDVSLFTREWIEIEKTQELCDKLSGLPLYEGVD